MSTSLQIETQRDIGAEGSAPLEILILDDMETDRMRLRRLCKQAGLSFRCHEAASVEQFREALEGPVFDIVFVDYRLGAETGLDALAALSEYERQAGAIAIMVSSLQMLDIAIEAMRMGCADYINKEELSVDAIRKSLALAFERRLLMSSLSAAQSAERDMRLMLTRIARTCGDEIRSVIAATLGHVRALGDSLPDGDAPGLSASLERLDGLCGSLGRYLDDLSGEAARVEKTAAGLGPRPIDPGRI